MVYSGARNTIDMASKATPPSHPRRKPSVRASVSFPSEVYRDLERIAEERKVSVAWVVRDAAEKYIADLHPLFGKS